MPDSVKKTKRKQRSQNYNDLIDVFGYIPGRLNKESGEIADEVQESLELLDEYNNLREIWAVKFQEALEFRAGAQWSQEERDVLEQRGQAPIVVNRIHPIVETAKSLLTYNSPEFRSSAREDSDRDTAKVFSDLFAWMWDQSSGNEELKKIVDDYYVGGMGVMHIYQDPMADLGKGEVFLKSINPLDVYIDPNAKDVYARDAAHILVVKYITDEQAMQLYPDFMDIIEDSDSAIDNDEEIPATDLAATEGQIFNTDEDTNYHTKRKYIERYTKEMHTYYSIYEPFSQKEYLFNADEYAEYKKTYYMRLTKATGEEVYISDEDAKEELLKVIEEFGPIFHFELPDPEIDDKGNLIPQPPVKVKGMEGPDAIPGSTTVITPLTAEEMIGMENIMMNKIEKCCVKLTATVGNNVLYTRILPTEEYPIVPLMNVHHRNPYPESDVRLYRPLQEYINKIRSLIIAHASTSTNVKLLIPRGSADLRQIEEEWSRAGTSVIEFDAELGAPIVAGPVPLPNELYKNEADAKYDLEYGFGIFELMQGSGMNSPSTYRGTLVVDEFGQRRIKSRRDDIENFLNQCAKVAVPLMQQIYTEEKVIRLVQPNGLEKEERFNFFKEMDNGDVMRFHDVTIGRYDVKVVSGSTLPTNRMAMLNTYMQMYQAGLIDQVEVLKKSELVDIDGVLARSGQARQMAQQMQMLQEELKKVKGDLQTATREELHAKKRLEVEKFSSDLDKISNRAESATQLYKARIADVENNLMNSVGSVEKELAEELDQEPQLGEMES
jgi:hypothetical protein|tara:strand:+ start:7035 stop:9368 length:2334 start_codon:yes stop_codon:yes gene_type:complete